MQTNIRLNQKPFYIIAISFFLIAAIVPLYLSFHFSKVGLPRYLSLTGIAFSIAGFYFWAEWQYVLNLKKALLLPIVEGQIFEIVNARYSRLGTIYKCKIVLDFKGQTFKFIPIEEYKNILVGTTVRIFFNEKNPQSSKLLKESRYLKISWSTLKDN